jgi:hypothetical protein
MPNPTPPNLPNQFFNALIRMQQQFEIMIGDALQDAVQRLNEFADAYKRLDREYREIYGLGIHEFVDLGNYLIDFDDFRDGSE